MGIEEFFQRYFVQPIYTGEGYNVYNTIAYGILLGVGIILGERLLHRLKLKVDSRFFMALLPFMVFASSSRSLVDAGVFPRTAWLITPGIFFTTSILAIASLFITLKLQRRSDFHRSMLLLGSLVALYPLYKAFASIVYLEPLWYMLALLPLSILIFIFGFQRLGYSELENPWIRAVFAGHLLDATATVVAVEYFDFFEEHVFENMLIALAGTSYIIYPLKLLVLVIIVYIINSLVEEKNRSYWYLVFFVLGFAPGLRDAFTVMLL